MAAFCARTLPLPRRRIALAASKSRLSALRSRKLPMGALLHGVLAPSLFIEIDAVRVVDDHDGEIFHRQAPDRLGPELGIRDDFLAGDPLREVRARAADRAEIDRAVLLERLAHRRSAL